MNEQANRSTTNKNLGSRTQETWKGVKTPGWYVWQETTPIGPYTTHEWQTHQILLPGYLHKKVAVLLPPFAHVSALEAFHLLPAPPKRPKPLMIGYYIWPIIVLLFLRRTVGEETYFEVLWETAVSSLTENGCSFVRGVQIMYHRSRHGSGSSRGKDRPVKLRRHEASKDRLTGVVRKSGVTRG